MEMKILEKIFPEKNYPKYKIKELKEMIPDSEVKKCGICETKFGMELLR